MNRINTENYEAYVLDYLEGRLNKEQREELKQFVLLHPELNLDLDADLPLIENEAVVYSEKSNIKREYTSSEEGLLEYLENTMDPAEKISFERQLEQNPVLAAALSAFQKTILQKEPEHIFEFKGKLNKNEDDFYLNNQTIQYLEGEFNHQEALAFEKELVFNSHLRTELGLYRKTRLVADPSEVFENKIVLKKETLILPLFRARVVYSAAAAIAFVVFLSGVMNYFLSPNDQLKNRASVAVVSPKVNVPTTSSVKQTKPALKINTPKVQEQFAFSKDKNPNTNSADPSVRFTNEPQARNELPVDTLSQPNINSVTGHSLALENPTNPVSTTDKESLEKLEYAFMVPFEEEEEEETSNTTNKKTNKRFWSFATRLAKKANQIGIKSINGSEGENNNYLLSFNAMTIEKK